MPITPSESVDAFLSWLSTPPNAPSNDAHYAKQHYLNGMGLSPDVEQKYAARLKELSRNPLEDMAKPMLLGDTLGGNDGKRSRTRSGKIDERGRTGYGGDVKYASGGNTNEGPEGGTPKAKKNQNQAGYATKMSASANEQ